MNHFSAQTSAERVSAESGNAVVASKASEVRIGFITESLNVSVSITRASHCVPSHKLCIFQFEVARCLSHAKQLSSIEARMHTLSCSL